MSTAIRVWVLLFWLPALALANPVWNPDGDNLYRLVRVHEPFPGEQNPEKRIDKNIAQLIQRLEPASADYTQVLRGVRSVRRVLTDDSLRPLYDLFYFAARNGVLTLARDTSPADASEGGQTGPSAPVPKLKGSWAGSFHLHLFERYEDFRKEIQDFSPSNPEDHFHYLDEFLRGEGIEGFAEYVAQFSPESYTKRGVFADIVRNWGLARSARMLAAGCALGILGFTAGYSWQIMSPADRMQQEHQENLPKTADPKNSQRAADEAATQWGKDAVEALLPSPLP